MQNLTAIAIERIKMFEPPTGYYLAFSGGKDSVVVEHLARMSEVRYSLNYSLGGIDPPELVQFIKRNYPNVNIERPVISIWQGVVKYGLPRRQGRWCCKLIKEKHGSGQRVITGIRWQESPRRASRKMVEVCRTDGTKTFVHPIIDWTSKDVWEYIKTYNLPYCSLYDEGFKRLGCVLCPMETPRQTQIELKRFPKLADAWKRAGQRFYNKQTEGVKRWATYEDMWQWWLSRKGEKKNDPTQCIMFDN
jgi:phosphoadenosine phosphosulfate reductase